MSLQALLTAPALRRYAGYAYARGEAYWRQGRVLSCVIESDAVVGVVAGGTRYACRLWVDGGELAAGCMCPVRDDFCKHAVALGLRYLEQRDGVAAPVAIAGGFTTRLELERWAEQHHVSHVLAVAADTLIAELPEHEVRQFGLRYVLGRLSVCDVGTRDGASRHLGARTVEAALVTAVDQLMKREAAVVAEGVAEESARASRSGDAELAPLWDRLATLRRDVRAGSGEGRARPDARGSPFPRSRAWRINGAWSWDPREPAVLWKERERIIRSVPPYGAAPIAVRLTMSSAGDAHLECTCGAARCTHALALIDATLDLLEDPTRALEARAIATELLRPGWSRALAELDRFEEKAAKPRAVIEVWWHVEHELGTLMVTPTVKKQTRRGAMSSGARMSAARLLDEHRESLADRDLRIAELLVTWDAGGVGSYPVRAFAALVGHPRVIAEDQPVTVVRVPLGFTALPAGDRIRLEPSLEGVRLNPKLLASLLRAFSAGEPLVVMEPDRCVLVDVTEDARQLWTVLEKHGDEFPPESHSQLLDRLARLEGRVPLVVPQQLKGNELAGEMVTVVRLRLLPDVTLELELFVRPGAGAPLFHPGAGPRDVMLSRGGERGYVRRRFDQEEATARAAIQALPLAGAEEGPPCCFRISDADAAIAVVAAAQMTSPGLEIEWVDQRPTISTSVGPEALRVHVERKRDWFGIEGELKVEAGRLELAVLLDAARRQQRFVRLDDHRWVELSDRLRQGLLGIADQTFASRNSLELSPGAVPAIRALAAAGAEVETAPTWQLLTERLAASHSLRPKVPATLKATLRDYQREGHAWLSRIAAWGAGACLADDMGLGKTVQTIAVLLDRAKLGPALVLAPTSVAFNWVEELARFAPSLRPVLYAEQADRAGCLTRLRKNDVVIASYGLLVRDAVPLAAVTFSTLVVDEAQALKNPNTRRARAARNLDAGFRIALSGTPFENHLGELWSLFAIIFPGLLGSWEQFRERFAGPIERGKDPEARAALSRVLRPFLLRRTKQEVARELPSRTEIHVPVALSKEEWGLYEDARLAAVVELGDVGRGLRDAQRRFQVLAALTRLRLLASHPRLYDPRSKLASSKMRRLLELLAELRSEGHRALVFSQFTSHLALVREELDKTGVEYLYLDGSTAAGARKGLIEKFQAGTGDVFLISLKAGGTGINLTAADYVIHLDPWWNPAVEDQATDRAHRIGQTRPVTVYRLITRGTIEEQILAMHGDKRALVAGVLDGTDVAARLTTRDLLALLAAGEHRASDDDDREAAPSDAG